jgi:hypothetical protein
MIQQVGAGGRALLNWPNILVEFEKTNQNKKIVTVIACTRKKLIVCDQFDEQKYL